MRSCQDCAHIGLISPVEERRSYWKAGHGYLRRCRACAATLQRERDAAREAALTMAERKALRKTWREQKRDQERRDPEGFRRRGAAASRRYEKRKREMRSATSLKEDRRFQLAQERERKGKALREVDESRYEYTGKLLPVEPFQAWLRTLVKREEAQGYAEKAIPRVARNLSLDESYLGKILKRKRPIDESVVDLAVTRHGGVTIQDVYESYRRPVAVVTDVEEDVGKPSACRDPACPEVGSWSVHVEKKRVLGVVEDGGPFCHAHAERLARIRIDLEGESALMSACGGAPKALSKDRRKAPKAPVCCASGCWECREPGERFCGGERCVTTGMMDGDGE